MEEWLYELDGDRHGPIDSADLKGLIGDGNLATDVLIWREGMADWQAANTVAEFKFPPPLPKQLGPAESESTIYVERFGAWFMRLGMGGKSAVVACGFLLLSCCCCPIPGMIFNIESDEPENGKPSTTTNAISSSGSELELGNEFQLGDFKYRIQSATQRKTVGSQFLNERANNGAIFVVVSYIMENCTKETQTVLADDMKLVDSEGRTFDPSSNANIALLAEDGKDFLLSELQPGIARTMKTVFEVPLSSLNGEVTLVVPEKGMFSSSETRVRIR